MDTNFKNDNQILSLLDDDSLLDHIYDPPLWSAGPYLKMVDEDFISCYSPVSDPLIRKNIKKDMHCNEYNSLSTDKQEVDFSIDIGSAQIPENHEPMKLSKKKVYLLTTFLSISAVILFGMVCL